MNELWTIVKNAPNALIYSVAVCFVAVVGGIVALSLNGSKTDDLLNFLSHIGTFLTAVFSGSSLLAAGAAAKSASKAEEQTNGALDGRMEAAVIRVLEKRDNGGNGPAAG